MKRALYILAELNDRDFDWLITAGRKEKVPAGKALIQEGETIKALYILLEGTLGVSVESLGEQEIAQLSSGEIVGEISFIDSRPPSATVKAVDDALVWAISRKVLTTKLREDVAFASHFYQAIAVLLADRLRGTVSRLGISGGPSADGDTAPLSEADLNPDTAGNLALAQVRLDWLLQNLKKMNY